MTPFEAFNAVDIRIGEVVRVERNEKANKPAYKFWIDFGELGEKTTSAQYTELYSPEDLVGQRVALYSFAANLRTVQTQDEMLGTLLDTQA